MAQSEAIFSTIIRMLLRPIVRFCLKHTVNYSEFLDVSRAVYVAEAAEALKQAGQEVNVSRVAVLTGLSRREVATYFSQGSALPEPSLIRKVLGRWQGDTEYRDAKGKPRTLNSLGNESEFAELVRGVSKDLNPYTILFELERAGMIERDGDFVILKSPIYKPVGDLKRGFQMVASDMEDLLEAVEENLFQAPDPLNLHIKTHYDNIDVESLPKIRAWFMKKGEELHEQARNFLSKFDKDLNPGLKSSKTGARVGIGTFSFSMAPKEVEATPEPRKRGRRAKP